MELYFSFLTVWNTLPFMDVAVFTKVQLQLLALQLTVMVCLGKLILSVKFPHFTQSARLASSSQMGKMVFILDQKLKTPF